MRHLPPCRISETDKKRLRDIWLHSDSLAYEGPGLNTVLFSPLALRNYFSETSSVAYYLEQIFLPHHKIKLPWTMIELLNVIPYILNLDKGIDLHHLESSSKKLK